MEKVETAVQSGVQTTISYYVDIYQQKRFWFDHRIASIKTEHRVKFDAMKKVYTITRSWAEPGSITTDSYEEAKQIMSRLEGVRAVSLTDLTRGEAYRVRARARLEEFTLPVYLKFFGLFADLDAFETDWQHAAFVLLEVAMNLLIETHTTVTEKATDWRSELMIDHHQGGVDMAEAVLPLTERAEVTYLADTIVAGQQAEIATMETMLEERKALYDPA